MKTAKFSILALATAVFSTISVFAHDGDAEHQKTFSDKPPLHHASFHGDLAEVKRLLDGGANPNAANDLRWTALFWLNKDRGDAVAVAKLLLEAGANPNAVGVLGRSALIGAANNGNAKLVKMLLEAGANPNQTEFSGRTALWYVNVVWSRAKTQEEAKGFREVHRLLREAGAE